MRSLLASAVLFCAGLATGRAIASSTTIIDFTIEVTEIRVSQNVTCDPDPFDPFLPDPDCGLGVPAPEIDPLFAGKAVGDSFSGILAITNPPAVRTFFGTEFLQYENTVITIDDYDPVLFSSGLLTVWIFGFEIFSGSISDPTRFFQIANRSLDLDPNDFSLMDLPTLMTSAAEDEQLFFSRRYDPDFDRTIFSEVGFDVTAASIRPEIPAVPLPAAGWLMLAGLGGLAALRRRG